MFNWTFLVYVYLNIHYLCDYIHRFVIWHVIDHRYVINVLKDCVCVHACIRARMCMCICVRVFVVLKNLNYKIHHNTNRPWNLMNKHEI